MSKTLIFTATYNEVDNIREVVELIFKYSPKVNLLVIDDSSPDFTFELLKKPDGRRQEIGKLNSGSKVFVDYAHTPDALKNILIAFTLNKKKPNLLFGCGGNRDKFKRKKMGAIANNFAGKIYITDDNPRNENPYTIRQSIISKCPRAVEIQNRRHAIKKAIYELNKDQILIIARKGHEKKQIIKNTVLNFDDAKIAKFYLNKRNKL